MGTLLHGIAASPGIGMGRVFLYHAGPESPQRKNRHGARRRNGGAIGML